MNEDVAVPRKPEETSRDRTAASADAPVLAGGAGRRLGGRKDGVLVGDAAAAAQPGRGRAVSDDGSCSRRSRLPARRWCGRGRRARRRALGALGAGLRRRATRPACRRPATCPSHARTSSAPRAAGTGRAGGGRRRPGVAAFSRLLAAAPPKCCARWWPAAVVAAGGARSWLRGALAEFRPGRCGPRPELAFLVNVNAADDVGRGPRERPAREPGPGRRRSLCGRGHGPLSAASRRCSPRSPSRCALTHASRFGGKRLRPALVHLRPARRAARRARAAAIVESLHLASLLHDDVLDGGHAPPGAHAERDARQRDPDPARRPGLRAAFR